MLHAETHELRSGGEFSKVDEPGHVSPSAQKYSNAVALVARPYKLVRLHNVYCVCATAGAFGISHHSLQPKPTVMSLAGISSEPSFFIIAVTANSWPAGTLAGIASKSDTSTPFAKSSAFSGRTLMACWGER